MSCIYDILWQWRLFPLTHSASGNMCFNKCTSCLILLKDSASLLILTISSLLSSSSSSRMAAIGKSSDTEVLYWDEKNIGFIKHLPISTPNRRIETTSVTSSIPNYYKINILGIKLIDFIYFKTNYIYII